jgi:hypothetical protein
VCFITAGPITKLFAWGEESGGRPLETRVGGPNFLGSLMKKVSTFVEQNHAIQRTTHSPGDEGARFMVVGGKDVRNGMTEGERDKFIKGMARVAQNNSMQMMRAWPSRWGRS